MRQVFWKDCKIDRTRHVGVLEFRVVRVDVTGQEARQVGVLEEDPDGEVFLEECHIPKCMFLLVV
jgi:hypothetical protein